MIKNMRLILWLLLAGLPVVAQAQSVPPSWTQDAYRERGYPAGEWYTGYASDRLEAGANAAAALKALERDAQAKLAESIIVKIQEHMILETRSSQRQSGGKSSEIITTEYKQAIGTATKATTVKTELRSYHDTYTGEIYAFAAVRRADLAAFYRKQIDVDLNKVETAVERAEQLEAASKKMSALRKVEEAEQIIDGVSFYCDLLVAVDAGADEVGLQTARVKGLLLLLDQMRVRLEQSTFVYMDCRYEFKNHKDDAFSKDPGIFCGIIKQALSENGCSIVDGRDEADYELSLTTSTTQRSDGKGDRAILSYYANVSGSLYNRAIDRTTVNFTILNDPAAYSAGRNPQDAATKAFKLPALKDMVLEKILPKIKD